LSSRSASNRNNGRSAAAVGLLAAALIAGCLDPLVDDEQMEDDDTAILPAGSKVPSAYDDPALAAQIDENDGVGRVIPLLNAFAGGEQVRYWTFGEAPTAIAPVYVVGRMKKGAFEKLPDHPTVFDVVPGDQGYTPWWQAFLVVVTKSYNGELLTSVEAIQEAAVAGLVDPPAPQNMYVNCPIVHGDARLDMGPDAGLAEPNPAYYKGVLVAYFDLGPALVPAEAFMEYPVADVYVLRREGGEPLSEPMRGVDMTGDGDRVDSNNIFEVGLDDPGYTPLWRMVEVVVPADYESIDMSRDDGVADYTSVDDLFEIDGDELNPVDENLIAFSVTETLVNCPLQIPPGGAP
jgi:hypothetical protein